LKGSRDQKKDGGKKSKVHKLKSRKGIQGSPIKMQERVQRPSIKMQERNPWATNKDVGKESRDYQ
jgi:hypothetical protein